MRPAAFLFLVCGVSRLHAQGVNSGYAPGSAWPGFGGAGVAGGRSAASLAGPTSVQPASVQAWSSWSGTRAASLAAGSGVIFYYTQGGMAPIGSVVRARCAAPDDDTSRDAPRERLQPPDPPTPPPLPFPSPQVSILPGQFISTQAIRHCNYQLSFCVNAAGNADYRHTVNAALNGMPPPFYSFQSTNYPGNWISPIAGNKIMFCPGGSLCNNPLLPPDDGTWLLTPGVPTAPSNFSFTSASRNPAYANFYLSASMTCIGAMVATSPAAAPSYRPLPPPPPSRSVHFSRFSPAPAQASRRSTRTCARTRRPPATPCRTRA